MARPASTRPTEVELQILRILWELGPSPVREIHKRLEADKGTNYSTTMGTGVTDAGVRELQAALPKLEILGVITAEDKAVAAITKLGGRIIRDEKAAGKPVIEVNFTHAFATDAALKELAAFKQLQTLNLCFPSPAAGDLILVTDAGLKELKELRSLKSLNLQRTKVTDKGLRQLAPLKQIQSLNLGRTAVTGAGLRELTPLKQLEKLVLLGTGVKDTDLKELAALNQLRELDLSRTAVTDEGLKELSALGQLHTLFLFECKVTDAGVADLRNALPKLLILHERH